MCPLFGVGFGLIILGGSCGVKAVDEVGAVFVDGGVLNLSFPGGEDGVLSALFFLVSVLHDFIIKTNVGLAMSGCISSSSASQLKYQPIHIVTFKACFQG